MRHKVLGAYGLTIEGLAEAQEWMQVLPDSSPGLRVESAPAMSTHARASHLDQAAADVQLVGGGRLRMRRGEGRALFSFREVPTDEDQLHPYLAPAAALAHLWAGSEALHGGAFATETGAVVLLADKQGGKSTTLAWLAAEHLLPVLSDDLVIVARRGVLSGPRCLDLRRADSLRHPDLGAARAVRNTERLRLTLPAAPTEAPLIATVMLRWGARTSLEAVAPVDRLRELLPFRMYGDRVAGDLRMILQLATLPMLILTRARGRAGLRECALALKDHFC